MARRMTGTDLEPLRERAVVGTVRVEPLIHHDVVAQLVLGVRAAAGATGAAYMFANSLVVAVAG